ncbi:MAG: BatA domain-containing protein [Pirellulales bacterium]
MPTFVNPALLWGLLILAVPVLIHLINLLRHRRVPWAAMEFLLASQRKNSTWIRLKELLLLLTRMAAIAAIVLLLAQPRWQHRLSSLFGGQRTHHVVLLDDSFSMSDRWADTSAFDQAIRVVQRIGEQASGEPGAQSFTLLRFSQAGAGASDSRPDFLKASIDTRFGSQLKEALARMRPSQMAVGPGEAVKAFEQLAGPADDEDRVVYLVSDFRAADWDQPGELAKALARLDQSRAALRLIDCVDMARPNLAITDLAPQPGTQAAGVPLAMAVTVKNFGSDAVRGVSVLLEEDGRPRGAVEIDHVAPGESETRRFAVFFSTAGDHVVAASLESDAVEIDNALYCLVDLPPAVPVLLVDGAAGTPHGRFLAAALAPGGAVNTGINPRIEPPAYLNNNPLDKFQAVYLLDVPRLDQPAIDALEAYVRGGGGLGVFLGDNVRAVFYNEKLHRGGQGLLPMPLASKIQLLVDRLETGPDLEVAVRHPVFKIFAGERNSFLAAVSVDWYISTPKDWQPEPDSTAEVVARLRNGAPLAVEHQFGAGRVMVFTTTAAPLWNNWGRNPSFVVAVLEMQSHLAGSAAREAPRLVGSPIQVQLDPARYRPQVRLVAPSGPEAGSGAAGGEAGPAAAGTGQVPGAGADVVTGAPPAVDGVPLVIDAAQGPEGLTASFPRAQRRGVYELVLTTAENKPEVRRLVFNVEAAEGDLAIIGGDELASRLPGVRYEFRQAADFHLSPRELAGANLGHWVLYLLVALLLGEQALAYSASYHPAAREGAP